MDLPSLNFDQLILLSSIHASVVSAIYNNAAAFNHLDPDHAQQKAGQKMSGSKLFDIDSLLRKESVDNNFFKCYPTCIELIIGLISI